MRIILIVIFIVTIFAIPVVIFGDRIEDYLNFERIIFLLKEHGSLAAVAGIAAISADLFIPTPAHAIMTGFGLVHGWFVGGVLASAGTFLAGTIAYWLSRVMGQRAARFIAGEEDMEKLHALFERYGFGAIIISRWIPIVPEVLSCLAGMTRMPHARFALGNLIGSLSVGFFYAGLGDAYGGTPQFALTLSVVLPFLLLPLFLLIAARSRRAA